MGRNEEADRLTAALTSPLSSRIFFRCTRRFQTNSYPHGLWELWETRCRAFCGGEFPKALVMNVGNLLFGFSTFSQRRQLPQPSLPISGALLFALVFSSFATFAFRLPLSLFSQERDGRGPDCLVDQYSALRAFVLAAL